MTEPVIRILVVDDHSLFRQGLVALLNAAAETSVIGEAGTGAEAIDQVERLIPDVILMDIQMADMNGIEATRRILADHSSIRIIMLTMLEDDDSLFAAMRAGARGHILKGQIRRRCCARCLRLLRARRFLGQQSPAGLTTFFNATSKQQIQSSLSLN